MHKNFMFWNNEVVLFTVFIGYFLPDLVNMNNVFQANGKRLMLRKFSYLLLAGALFSAVGQVQAIAVADLPTSEAPPANEGYTFNWGHVHQYNGSSSVAVDHYWVLTAGHVATGPGSITNDMEIYTQQEFVMHSQAADPDGNPTADLALIRFDKPFPGYYLLHDSIPQNTEVLVVGYGFPGDVVMSSFSGYFTENEIGSRIRRWGTNKIDGLSSIGNSEGFGFTISGTAGNSKTPYEAGCNDKDSGSGVFYNDSGTWKLVGTVGNRYTDGSNFVGNFAVETKRYINWIKSVIGDYDTDMDGLPNWWELLHGVDETSMERDGQLDSDDFTNYEEWLADTDPNDGNSFLEMMDYTNATSVVFSSSTNRKYQVQYRIDIADTNEIWETEVDWFDGSLSQTVQSVSIPTSNRFYRVRAKLY